MSKSRAGQAGLGKAYRLFATHNNQSNASYLWEKDKEDDLNHDFKDIVYDIFISLKAFLLSYFKVIHNFFLNSYLIFFS